MVRSFRYDVVIRTERGQKVIDVKAYGKRGDGRKVTRITIPKGFRTGDVFARFLEEIEDPDGEG